MPSVENSILGLVLSPHYSCGTQCFEYPNCQRHNFADVVTDLVADGEGHVVVTSNSAYTLIINGCPFKIEPGSQKITPGIVPNAERP